MEIYRSGAPAWALGWAVIVGAGLSWAAAASAQELPLQATTDAFAGPVLERRELSEAVLGRNPGIAAARSAWQAALERVPQATSLDDPTASAGIAPLSLVDSGTRLGFQARVAQRFPFRGELRLRGEVAQAEAAAAEERVDEVRLHLATMASLLFDQYYLVVRALEVNAQHLQLLEDFQGVAIGRYRAGVAPQQAPIQAEVEAAHLMHREVVLRTRRRTLVAQINALLHREPGAPLPPPPDSLGVPAAPEPSEELLAAMLERRPEIRAQRAEIEARRAAVSLERLDFYPDFEVSTSYNSMWRATEHRWMIGVGVNVPIWRKRIRAGVAEAEALLDSEESELALLEDEALADAEVALLELEEARHVIHLYENRVIPASRDQVAAARSGFETGANTMLALIDAERSLRTAELNYHQAVADVFSRRADLDRALGRLPFTAGGPATTAEPAAETEETN